MITTVFILTGLLALSQTAERPEWLLTPRLSRGQELVYRGKYTEEALDKTVQFTRAYAMENRVFVLDTSARGAEVAVFTVLRIRGDKAGASKTAEVSSVRLERGGLNPQGKFALETFGAGTVPLDAPPTIETGFFAEVPRGRGRLQQPWEVAEQGRPPVVWSITGNESINGNPCIRLEGLQQSADWDRPRADSPAWRRHDRVWLAAASGCAQRVERVIERREPARTVPTQRSVTRYDLESALTYPPQVAEDRRREIQQAQVFAEAAAPLLPEPGKQSPQRFESLLGKIAYHLEHQPPTPYREAVHQVKRRIEAAVRGEAPPQLAAATVPITLGIAYGKSAPPFTLWDIVSKQSVQLQPGKPTLLVFFHPASRLTKDVLAFAQRMSDSTNQKIAVYALSLGDDPERVLPFHAQLQLTIPLLNAASLRSSYAIDATPKLVVLDAGGSVRGSYVGWGYETPLAVQEELRRWLRDGEVSKSGTALPKPKNGILEFPALTLPPQSTPK